MSFDLYCPECETRLRLDEEPDPDTPIECPRCGSTFTPDESVPAPKAGKKNRGGSTPPGGEKKKKADQPKTREFMNPGLLLAIIGAGLGAYIAVSLVTIHLLGKAGRVTDMMAYLPGDCMVARGVNLKILNRFPGYKPEYDKYVVPDVAATMEALLKASALADDQAFIDYMLAGASSKGAIFAFRCREDFDPQQIGQGLGGEVVDVGGTPCYQLPPTAPGLLSWATIYMPTYRHVVIVRGLAPPPRRPDPASQRELLRESLKGFEDPDKSFVAGLTDCGEKCMSGHTWVLIRNTLIIQSIGMSVKEDKALTGIARVAQTAKEIGAWNSFGGRVRFGVAIDCGSSDDASDLASELREGEYGKGDEAEISRTLKSAFNGSHNKEFLAYLAAMSFDTSGSALCIVSSVSGEQGIKLLQSMNIAGSVAPTPPPAPPPPEPPPPPAPQ